MIVAHLFKLYADTTRAPSGNGSTAAETILRPCSTPTLALDGEAIAAIGNTAFAAAAIAHEMTPLIRFLIIPLGLGPTFFNAR